MDLVYIVKKSEVNEDLRYSLRSVAKFVPHDNVWIVGYKPKWVVNVNYLPVEQKGDKWKNSVTNIIEACKCPDISEDFVLMNDDFYATKPITDLKESISVNLGTLDKSLQTYSTLKSGWGAAFKQLKELLELLKVDEPFYDYESHIPLIINKTKYLEVMDLPEVQAYRKTSKVLHKRSLYKNIEKLSSRTLSRDVKINRRKDDTKERMQICDWISTYDGQVGDWINFRDLNRLLYNLFPDPCKFEFQKDSTIKHKRDSFMF